MENRRQQQLPLQPLDVTALMLLDKSTDASLTGLRDILMSLAGRRQSPS